MTSKQLTSPCRRKPRGKAKPSIELASVYLELKSRVEPSWDNPEPDDYIVGLDGDVMVSGSGEDKAPEGPPWNGRSKIFRR
jgi:hypothetical protein